VGVARGQIDLRGAHNVPVHVRLHDHLGGGAELLPVQVLSGEQQFHGRDLPESQQGGERGVLEKVNIDQCPFPPVGEHLRPRFHHYFGPFSGLLLRSSRQKVADAHGTGGQVHLLHDDSGQCQDAHVAGAVHHLYGHPAIGLDGCGCGHFCLLFRLHLGYFHAGAAHHSGDHSGRDLPQCHAPGRGPGIASLLQCLQSVLRGHVHRERLASGTGHYLHFVRPEGEFGSLL